MSRKTIKILKILSNFLLVINPICGIAITGCIGKSLQSGGYWWLLMFPLCGVIALNLNFHFWINSIHYKYSVKEFFYDSSFKEYDY